MFFYVLTAALLFTWGAVCVRWGWKGFLGLPILLIALGVWRGCLDYNDGSVKVDLGGMGGDPIKIETPAVPSVNL